jgi:hypothetical protein
MNENWINFKELRSKLSFPAVLEKYGVKLTMKGGQLVGFCPLPGHNGNKNSPSFSAHPERGIFQCFGCGGKGNVLDFAVLMDKGNPESGADLRRTALALQKAFCLSGAAAPIEHEKPGPRSQVAKDVGVNEPLIFRLKDLDPGHPYLLNRGFLKETMIKFGVGLCRMGFFAERITIPLHDSLGQLIGYAGRVMDDASVSVENPKYLFPGKREVEGRTVEFKKSLFLYNGFRLKPPLDRLIILKWWR